MLFLTHLQSSVSVRLAASFGVCKPFKIKKRGKRRFSLMLLSVLFMFGGFGAIARAAKAQNSGTLAVDAATGAVTLDNNAFDIQTGELTNESDIPLPDGLPAEVQDRTPIPTFSDRLAPNTVEIRPDVEFVERSFNEISSDRTPGTSYDLQESSLRFSSQFNLDQREGDHAFGEGIQVTVFDENGDVVSQETAFVRGYAVRQGPDGEELPESATIDVSYGPSERVELRVLNIRQNGADPSESGIYFAENGEFIVEDLQNGGDRDFNDGDYVRISGGQGEADSLEVRENITVETRVSEEPLPVEVRVEEREEVVVVEPLVEGDEAFVEEERDFGQVEVPDTVSTWLGHASGVRAETGEQLVYSRYTNESQFRLGSDGVGVTGQLRPLVGNPNVPPTLLNGNLNFDPFVGDNEAGLTGRLGVTQYLNRTHRVARDAFGNEIVSASGDRLLEPAGLLSNRRWVGYVPSTPDEQVRGERVFSVDGIFELPTDQAVAIAPSDATRAGRGEAAYTNNVGGLLIEYATGEVVFAPQWNANGFLQETIELEAGAARRVIYALVPQQAGQNLVLGEQYAVGEGENGYVITDGGFTVISADRHPQNFVEEGNELYAVEDTLEAIDNAQTAEFNGIRGLYAETVGGERVPTVDVTLPDEVDARVSNELFPLNTAVGDAGQRAYSRTTRAAGFYASGSLTGGVGNQEDTVTRSSVVVDQAMDAVQTIRTLNRFETPVTRREEVTVEVVSVEQSFGVASFDINENGELVDTQFIGDVSSNSVEEQERIVGSTSQIVRGEEILVDSVPVEAPSLSLVDAEGDLIEADELETEETTRSDSYPNFSALQGEIALGAVLNFGNTPWTTAANTVRAEVFARDVVVGRGSDGVKTGWRAEAAFHPFGEQQRDAYQYDESGMVVPVYKTEPVLDGQGDVLMEIIRDGAGNEVAVAVNQFVVNEVGDRVAQKVGTGVARGPGLYVSVEDVTDDDKGIEIAGGLQFSF